ncbi:MAG: peptidylprolyl isomerase [Phycisphaerales bacterium]
MTVAEQLDDVQTAIRQILRGAQSYRLRDGTEVTRASLATLEQRETTLLQRQRQEEGGAGLYRRAGFFGSGGR